MEQLTLPRMAVEITTRCNLRCKYCAYGIPFRTEEIHLHPDAVKDYLGCAFEIVDSVDSLEVAGGEPLLHEQLTEILRAYMEYRDRFRQFLIVTNGTVMPSERLFAVLREYRDSAVVHISDYGMRPETTRMLTERLDAIGVRRRVDRYWGEEQYQGGWVDPGDVSPRKRTRPELEAVFSDCGLKRNGGCWRIREGRMHFCARSCRCAEEGYVFPEDFLDLTDRSRTAAEKREKLRALLCAPYLSACDFCNGTMGTKDPEKRIPAAEQLTGGNEDNNV